MQEITLRLRKCFENSLTVKVEHENEIMNFSSAPTLMAKTFVCTSQTATRVYLLLIFKEKINKAWLPEVCLKLISCDISVPKVIFLLKCNNSNSTLAVRSGFDLHRFLQVKKNRKTSCLGWDSNLGPADQKSVMLTITP